MSAPTDALQALARLVEAFERLGIRHAVGGSLASGLYGEPRGTHDVDLVCDLRCEHVEPLVQDLGRDFYIDRASVREAIERRSSFNVIRLRGVQKIDVFVAGDGLLDRQQLERRMPRVLSPELPAFHITSAEDVVLRKLDWFKRGEAVSERQWRDVLSVLKVQARALDQDYLMRTARSVGLEALLQRALAESALVQPGD